MILLTVAALVLFKPKVGQSSFAIQDLGRLDACRAAVMNSQRQDGCIVQVPYTEASVPLLVDPYFANYACLGILAAHGYHPRSTDLPFVGKWLAWYAQSLTTFGGIQNFNLAYNTSTNTWNYSALTPDSFDAYAGTYLLVASWYARETGAPLPSAVIKACLSCVATLNQCQGTGTFNNGFFWNFPPSSPPKGITPGQYLTDNVEAYQGLSVAPAMFRQAGQTAAAAECETMATSLASLLSQFWSLKYSAFCTLFGDVAAGVPFAGQSVHNAGLTTATALAFFNNLKPNTSLNLWNLLQQDYGSQLQTGYVNHNYTAEDPTIERTYLAVVRAAPSQRSAYLTLLRNRIDNCTEQIALLNNPNHLGDNYPQVHRFGGMILALVNLLSPSAYQMPTVPLNPSSAP